MEMRPRPPRGGETVIRLLVLGLLAGVLAGCGSGSHGVVRPPETTATASTPASSPTTAVESSSTSATANPTLRLSPATGVHDQQVVTVNASGFTPGEALTVIQCADKGTATGPGDCNLAGMLAANADGTGRVTTTLKVVRGPFGGNHIVCSAHQQCLISVTQASLSPTQEADATITFAATG